MFILRIILHVKTKCPLSASGAALLSEDPISLTSLKAATFSRIHLLGCVGGLRGGTHCEASMKYYSLYNSFSIWGQMFAMMTTTTKTKTIAIEARPTRHRSF